MSICKYCRRLSHVGACTRQRKWHPAAPTPKPRTYRIEWFGSLQVHQPVKP